MAEGQNEDGLDVWCVFDGVGKLLSVGVDQQSALYRLIGSHGGVWRNRDRLLCLRPDVVREGWTVKRMKLGGEA